MARKKQQTPMRLAINELYAIQSGSGLASPEEILATAKKYEVEVWTLEYSYLDEVDANADA